MVKESNVSKYHYWLAGVIGISATDKIRLTKEATEEELYHMSELELLQLCEFHGVESGVLLESRHSKNTPEQIKKEVEDSGICLATYHTKDYPRKLRKEARQIVDHKHVLVNGKQVNIPSYLIKAGDTIEIKEKCKSSQRYKDILEVTAGRLVPEWLEADQENLKGIVKELPSREAIDVPVDEMLIVELYSK